MKLVLYSRHACHLCEVMQKELAAYLQGNAMELEIRDVDQRPQWREDYGLFVPLLQTEDGHTLCEYELDTEKLDEFLTQSAGR